MVSGHNAKVQYLQKNIDKRIDSFVADIKNDIKKLGLDIGNIEIVSGINAALGHLKKSVSGATPPPLPQQSGATPPPLPKQSGATPPPLPKQSGATPPPLPQQQMDVENSEIIQNPNKSKIVQNRLDKYLPGSPSEAEEDLDKLFWK
jgi:hypothetical protein